MLSYRHSFHAGNFADVIKHIVLIEALEHLTKKDKPFDYIDTHSGAGLFNLESEHSNKIAEHRNGISKLDPREWPELTSYFDIIKSYNKLNVLRHYPGSPLISMRYLRPKDNAWLYELHSSDYEFLKNNVQNSQRAKAACQDGLRGLLSHLPPASRRALVLIDPSYEIKADYRHVFETIETAYKKFSTGTYLLWYPVVDRKRVTELEKKFINSGIKDIQRFELGLSSDSAGRGMTSSGVIAINPPWGLYEKMSALLPRLVTELGLDEGAFFKCDILVSE